MLIKNDAYGPSGAGELTIDHSNSPELPAGLGGRALFEAETYTCTHCNAVVVMNPARIRERYKCRGCNHHICDGCAAERTAGAPCKTIAQKIDELAAEAERVSSGGILLPSHH